MFPADAAQTNRPGSCLFAWLLSATWGIIKQSSACDASEMKVLTQSTDTDWPWRGSSWSSNALISIHSCTRSQSQSGRPTTHPVESSFRSEMQRKLRLQPPLSLVQSLTGPNESSRTSKESKDELIISSSLWWREDNDLTVDVEAYEMRLQSINTSVILGIMSQSEYIEFIRVNDVITVIESTDSGGESYQRWTESRWNEASDKYLSNVWRVMKWRWRAEKTRCWCRSSLLVPADGALIKIRAQLNLYKFSLKQIRSKKINNILVWV